MAEFFTYALSVPIVPACAEGGAARYACCHNDASRGHHALCTDAMRREALELALRRLNLVWDYCATDARTVRARREQRHHEEVANEVVGTILSSYLKPKHMRYAVRFTTARSNTPLLALVLPIAQENSAGKEVPSQDDSQTTLLWECADEASAVQLEARIKAAVTCMVGVEPIPDVDGGGLPAGPTSVNPNP